MAGVSHARQFLSNQTQVPKSTSGSFPSSSCLDLPPVRKSETVTGYDGTAQREEKNFIPSWHPLAAFSQT